MKLSSPSGSDRRVRFVPAAARTPLGCRQPLPELSGSLRARACAFSLLADTFEFDFLCIHRFVTARPRIASGHYLLLHARFPVARYISLERLVEESKEDYYRVLGECSRVGTRPNEFCRGGHFLGVVRFSVQRAETK